ETLSQCGDSAISGLQYDSRRVRPGDLFVAMRGESADGNRFLDAAIAQGAAAVVTDSAQAPLRGDLPWAQVVHGRRALARLSANFYGRPAEKLPLTGITGTNGKTTTSFLLESIFASAKRPALLVGTIEYHVAGRVLPAPHTTPESLELNQLFAQALASGASEGVMEVSSHALAQQRVFGMPFDVAVFTNLTRDHLDYHRTMEDYFAAKRVLFEGCGTAPPRVSILNHDDPAGARIAKISQESGSRVVRYGLESGDFHARGLESGPTGTHFHLASPQGSVFLQSPLLGRVNVHNILAAAAAGVARGCSLGQVAAGVEALRCVPGRFQQVECGQPFAVVVDYAHTDDALRNLTALAREFAGRTARVLTVFGCGGDRDRAKRPLMGEAAGRGSDFVVVTSDNPRSEDPQVIIEEAVAGLRPTGTRFTVEPDRTRAIGLAIAEARPGDIVLVAGKGHEKVQVTRAGSAPFDDVAVAGAALAAAGYATAPTGGRR
ncbi:MAG TPA: UDP-N-acetylmuramoyl-L-alanyl-D-glutamate--2,6-diaminopimelate ligase, partial [Terriglobales bacterium]|nr:UDP-N-acetylmuramoyl-L-alanyl-D-glutamate--2,6-diaminopimelate ligase [Terriglobales bacterium]